MSLDSRMLAQQARVRAIEMCARARAAHIGSSLSVIDILSVLYSTGANVSPDRTRDPDRDFVIVSKGHAAAGTYATLCVAGFFPEEWLQNYGVDGSPLGGHVTSNVPGVEVSSGSLGHGLPIGTGIAFAKSLSRSPSQVFVVLSDGECDEGTTWESALFASHHELSNLTVLIDRNGIQSLGETETTLRLEPLTEKWRSFGWHTLNINGHDHDEVLDAIQQARSMDLKPTVIVCETIKGKGVSFMENSVLWHYRPPSHEDAERAIAEISGDEYAR